MDFDSPPPPPNFNGDQRQEKQVLVQSESSKREVGNLDTKKPNGNNNKISITIVLIIVVICILIGIGSQQQATSPTFEPTITLKVTKKNNTSPTIKPKATNTSFASTCRSWQSITQSDSGKTLCAYGIVLKSFFGDKNRFFIVFGEENNAFRMISLGGYYFPNITGECVSATGVIKMYGNMPYMELGDNLYSCQ